MNQWGQIEFGIEQYFVQEGKGRARGRRPIAESIVGDRDYARRRRSDAGAAYFGLVSTSASPQKGEPHEETT